MSEKEYDRDFLKDLNSKVLDLINIKSDDKVSKPVRFYFYSTDENKASDLAIELHNMGGDISPVDKLDEKWSIIVEFEKTRLAKNNIDDLTEVMVSLAEEFNCTYDGWETEM